MLTQKIVKVVQTRPCAIIKVDSGRDIASGVGIFKRGGRAVLLHTHIFKILNGC